VSYRSTCYGTFRHDHLSGRFFHECQIQRNDPVPFHAAIGFAEQRQIGTRCDEFLDIGSEEVPRQTRAADTGDVDSTFVHEGAGRAGLCFGNLSQQTTRLIDQCRIGGLVRSAQGDKGRYQILFQCEFRNGRGRSECFVNGDGSQGKHIRCWKWERTQTLCEEFW